MPLADGAGAGAEADGLREEDGTVDPSSVTIENHHGTGWSDIANGWLPDRGNVYTCPERWH